MGVKLLAASSGSVELVPANTASNYSVTVPAATTTMVGTDTTQTLTNKTYSNPTFSGTASGTVLVSGTAVSASSTAVDFTGIPSWVKRITVMLQGVSTNGTSAVQVQIGSGSVTTTGYVSTSAVAVNAGATVGATSTTGFIWAGGGASSVRYGCYVLTNVSGNAWCASLAGAYTDGSNAISGGGGITLGGTIDRVRVTTVNTTDTFDAGTINILYE